MYMPLFVEMQDKEVLIVGGGAVALRKAKKLLAAGAKVTLMAPRAVDGWQQLPVRWQREIYRDQPLTGYDLVVAATDDVALNGRIAARAAAVNVWCNQVTARGTVILPAVIERGGLTVAVSGGGEAPFLTKKVKAIIAEALPPLSTEDFAFWAEMRRRLAATCPRRKEELMEKLWAADWRQRKEEEGYDEIMSWLQGQ